MRARRRGATRLPIPARTRGSAFTLIEIMAVILILALIAAVVGPRISAIAGQAVMDDGRQLAAALDFARGKAMALGREHRVVLDVGGARYWIEAKTAVPPPAPTLTWAELDELPLVAPRMDAFDFAPLAGAVGRPSALRANVRFAAVDGDVPISADGFPQITFARDGATTPARIWLESTTGVRVRVDVALLADPTKVSIDAAP
jgi:prepilin-type N-terminal cleavage/methylation domain-containing protein